MRSAESPSLSEAYNESDIAPRDGGHNSFDESIRIAPQDSRHDERMRWTRSEASHRGSYFENNRSARKKPSIVKRMHYATTRFVVVVLIGVAATLAWQAYGDEARARLATWDPALAWLAPLPAAQPTPAAALSSADLAQQLKPMAAEIAAIRQDVAQLAGKQDQSAANEGRMAQGLAVIHALEQDIALKVSSLAQPKPIHAQPPRQPTQLQPHQPALRPAAQRPAQPLETPEQ